jgi:hypothetical protein
MIRNQLQLWLCLAEKIRVRSQKPGHAGEAAYHARSCDRVGVYASGRDGCENGLLHLLSLAKGRGNRKRREERASRSVLDKRSLSGLRLNWRFVVTVTSSSGEGEEVAESRAIRQVSDLRRNLATNDRTIN